jgi:hypothetical protein
VDGGWVKRLRLPEGDPGHARPQCALFFGRATPHTSQIQHPHPIHAHLGTAPPPDLASWAVAQSCESGNAIYKQLLAMV